MKMFESFDDFWREYFTGEPQQATGFDTYTIAKFTHTTDADYAQAKAAGQDRLGFQPTLLTLASPHARGKSEVVVRGLATPAHDNLRGQYRRRFAMQLPARFGLFHAGKNQADAVFKTFEAFEQSWLQSGGQSVLAYNLPLLFDHVSDVDYWAWRQKGFDPCGTQRLIITIFQYRTGRFADVFLTDVDDAEMARIALLIKSKMALQAEQLF